MQCREKQGNIRGQVSSYTALVLNLCLPLSFTILAYSLAGSPQFSTGAFKRDKGVLRALGTSFNTVFME